ncbi:CHAT domain-containing protein [Boletus edulis BED1]|uniref:CHAT domain-containing protein n=1 Tax=Boletus edulis BED1 TaxID=1328754 RepID=A0AAD4GBQ9_BOLED|nr:CHAT domain-containing protein [Boletus edulis BED1]
MGEPAWVQKLHSRANTLAAEFKRGGGTSCIDEAIELDREALELCPSGHPDQSVSLTRLAAHLGDRYRQLGVMRELEEAIVCDQEALDLRPTGHPDRSISLNGLAIRLSLRYKQLGNMEDLDEAIALDREALYLLPQGHPDRSASINNLALYLSTRYKQLGFMENLDEAIALGREALHLRPRGHPDRWMSLNNLALHLSTRYNQLGVMDDLDDAIALDREALDLCSQRHHDRSMSLNNLAVDLSTRYKQLGIMEDLDEAIVLDRKALDLRPEGHPDRSMSLNNLAVCLSTRYNQLGVMEDLDEAIALDRQALYLRAEGHPDWSTSLNNLALDLSIRYKQLGVIEDLDEAIILDRQALDLRPQGHPDRSMSLNNLALDLSMRYKRFEFMENLDEAIALGREALDLRPKGHPDRWMSLNNLALHLSTRYNQLEVMDNLNEAIFLCQEALDLCPRGHPDWSASLDSLACYLHDRFRRSRQLKDQDELFGLYALLVYAPQVVSSVDLSVARTWIRVAEDFQHPTILLAYETSLQLLIQHLATLPSLPQHLSILKNLTSSLAVDAFSACLRNNSPAKAVELLEQGRGVFWSQLTRLRSPLDDVIASGVTGKELAAEFTRLAVLIRNTFNSPGVDQHERVCRLNLEIQKVVTSIRELPGFSRLLLPSLFSDLQRAASEGPVIIVNASKYSCDALVILLDHVPVHIPLHITQEDVRGLSAELRALTVRAVRVDVTRELAAFLRKLWERIVLPIVDFLCTTYPPQSRIWWCPTGEFSVFPLHAAGPFRKGQQNLPDIYLSSYTPTLTALIRARRCEQSSSTAERKCFIAVGQAKSAGGRELLSVGTELENIGHLVSNVATFTFTHINGEESCTSRVIEELGRNQWVHFACHGLPNRTQPFESAFALYDGRFTIQRIIGCDLKNPEFAYLSACHTTVGDEESPDELIHLASAMQFIGFRSVIGTMWAVDDAETNKITSTFYKHMVDGSGRLDHTRAAFALNKTMKSVRIPLDQQILYIHIGA